jgi:hypothetical protein
MIQGLYKYWTTINAVCIAFNPLTAGHDPGWVEMPTVLREGKHDEVV